MSDRSAGLAPSRITAILGPTNTGKTHLAVERMLGHASGMIGLPLRLLAREIYERIVKQRGAASVALITGEEKIIPPRPAYFVCTVEAMPMERQVEFLAVDEIQLVADPERGHVFTQRLLHARGRFETMFLGAGTMAPLVRRLIPDVEIISRERLSTLSYAGSKKLTRLPRRSAVVAFSTEQVYAIAELLRRQRGGAAVVMGSLSPRTRNAQVELFQSGEVDFLVATDAIGMGLNMDVDHVAFAGLRKFDGRRTRWLYAPEVAQIAGRAGRHLRDGTFGVTGEAEDLDEDLVEQVVEHRFDPIEGAEWRNSRLDFDTLPDLLRSLTITPDRAGLRLTAQALDETLLRRFAQDDDIKRIAKSRGTLMRLWETCQLPDFQKTTLDEHGRLAKDIFYALTSRRGRLTEDWVAPRFNDLDRDDGQIDQLSARLAGVRTLSYIANRPDWMDQQQYWREKTKVLEERLSDVLHQALTARFVDRRTTALMRALNVRSDTLAGVDDTGQVTIEGEVVGRLQGVMFTPDEGGSALAERALRQAATRAVAPEIGRRLKVLAKTDDAGFTLEADGSVLWQGAVAARLTNEDVFHPRVMLIGAMGDAGAREAAQKRIEDWLTEETGRALRDLKRLKRAVDDGVLKGLVRGIAWRLVEAGGAIARSEVQADLAVLSPDDRRALSKFAVRIGTHAIWLPSVLKPRALSVARAFVGRDAPKELKGEGLLPAPRTPVEQKLLSAFGRQVVGRFTVPVEMLEDYAEQQRKAGRGDLSKDQLEALGWSEMQVRIIRSALRPPRRDEASTAQAAAPVVDENSPFAALMGFKVAEAEATPAPKRDKKKKPKAKKAKASDAKPEAATAEGEAADAPAIEGEATDPARKKRRRRRKPKGNKTETVGVEGQDAAVEGAEAIEAPEAGDTAPAPKGETADPARKKRRRRRKSKSKAEAGQTVDQVAGPEVGPEVSEGIGEPTEADGTIAPEDEAADPAAPKKRRRRRSRKPKTPQDGASVPSEGAAEAASSDAASAEPAPAPAPAAASPEPSSPPPSDEA